MIPSVSLHLLTQDNAIPGNAKDGFRYHHLLFVIITTPIYLWFELAFGVRLLDAMASHVEISDTKAIEHWGRLISGAALALLMLSTWFRHCEKEMVGWRARIPVSVGLVLGAFVVAWWVQELVLNFYVERPGSEIPWALGSLALLLAVGFVLMRLWMKRMAGDHPKRFMWLSLGVIAMLGIGYAQIALIKNVNPVREKQLGLERQQTATLAVVRRAMQEGLYDVPTVYNDPRALDSPEGMAFLSLMPIFGSVLDQAKLAEDRAELLAELMYREWDKQYGAQVYESYRVVEQDLEQRYVSTYRDAKVATSLGDRQIAPRTSFAAFRGDPAVTRHFRNELGCFDCAFVMGMSREGFGREFYTWVKAHEVKNEVERLNSPESFERGRDGERAARVYWAPIWALLFSMLGAFTHVFKLIVTVTAYAHRLTFNRIDAADSPLANEVIANSTAVTVGAVIAAALFIYFSDNRITGNAGYIEHRERLWQLHPIVGGVAAHWTVNTQGLIYPFTKKIRPDWLEFDHDPIQQIPLVRHWVGNEYDE